MSSSRTCSTIGSLIVISAKGNVVQELRVSVSASDPITISGLVSALAAQGVVVEEGPGLLEADVRVVATDALTPAVLSALRGAARTCPVPVVLIVNRLQEKELLAAVECQVVAVLPRSTATAERVLHSVRAAAAGGGVLPPALVRELLEHVERLQRELLEPNGVNAAGLNPREVDVLRLMADGWCTAKIAGELSYSERTVKNVIAGLTQRLNLRNRPHAVAYALRTGVI